MMTTATRFAFCYPCGERRAFAWIESAPGRWLWLCADCLRPIGSARDA